MRLSDPKMAVWDHQGPGAAAVGGDVDPRAAAAARRRAAPCRTAGSSAAGRAVRIPASVVERAFAGINLRREAALPHGIAELRL